MIWRYPSYNNFSHINPTLVALTPEQIMHRLIHSLPHSKESKKAKLHLYKCAHIKRITQRTKKDMNRKGYDSINTQVLVNAYYTIIYWTNVPDLHTPWGPEWERTKTSISTRYQMCDLREKWLDRADKDNFTQLIKQWLSNKFIPLQKDSWYEAYH